MPIGKLTEDQKDAIMELFYNSHDNQVTVIAEKVNASQYLVSNLITRELNKKQKRINLKPES